MDRSQAPLVLFVYNRPDHTLRALTTLAQCDRFNECHLVIYCDGPKTPAHEAGVAVTRRVLKDWASRSNAEIIERSENLGLARSIVTGVTEQCRKYGKAIVVEDDLVVSPDFLDYMLQALERYKDYRNVYQISGFMYPIEHPTGSDAFFLPLTTTWGWATWERAWKIFDWNTSEALKRLDNPDVSKKFDLDGSFPYTAMLHQRAEARNDSWGILWWFAVFNANGVVLHPRNSLVWNGGFDNSGIHSGAPLFSMQASPNRFTHPSLSKPLVLPEAVDIDQEAFDRLKRYLRSRSNPRNRVRGIIQKISRTLIDRQNFIKNKRESW